MRNFNFDVRGTYLLTPREVRRELACSVRWFAYRRAERKGSSIWQPAIRQPRGFKGEIGLYRPDQVEAMKAEIAEERATAARERKGGR